MSPTGFFIEGGLCKPAESVDRSSVSSHCAGGKQRTGRLVHEGHEFIGKPRHGATDTDATDVRTPAYASHPATFANIALYNRSPTPQLHDALNVAVLFRKFGLLVVAGPVTPFVNRLPKEPSRTKALVERDHGRSPCSHIEQIEERLHEVVWLNGASRDAHNRNSGGRFPGPTQVISQPHASRRVSFHGVNSTVGGAGTGSDD